MLECLLDAVFRYQPLVFGKSDEQQAIQQLLGGLDEAHRRMAGVVFNEPAYQQFPQGLVVGVELVGDLLIGLLALVQQFQRLAGEQVVRMQQQDEAGILFWINQVSQAEGFIHQ